MSDVSTWNPLDESNTAAPPDGWPEFMQPSMVNNTGRMMMGAVRRMYDQLAAGSLVLPYLKLSGGTVSGAVTVTGALTVGSITSSTTIFASGGITGATLSSSGHINGGTTMFIAGAATIGGSLNANAYLLQNKSLASTDGTGVAYYDNAPAPTLFLQSNGNSTYANTAHYFKSRDGVTLFASIASGGLSTPGLTVSGSAAVGGLTVTGSATVGTGLTVSTGNITAANGSFFSRSLNFGESGGRFVAVGADIMAGGSVWAQGNPSNFGLTTDGTDYMLKFRSDCFLRYQNSSANLWWQLGPTIGVWAINADGFCHADANAVGGNGAYVNFSDESLKTDIEPAPQGLDIILGLQPMRFRRLPREGMPPPRLEVGFIAQQVQATFPEAVVEVQRVADSDPILGLDDGAIVAALVGAVKTLEARLTAGGL